VNSTHVSVNNVTQFSVVTKGDSTTVLGEDEETGETLNWTYVIRPVSKCEVETWICIPTSKFEAFEHFSLGEKNFTEEELEEIKLAYIDFMVTRLDMFITGLNRAIASALVDRRDEFYLSQYMMVTLDGSAIDVKMYAIGLVVEDISDINYIGGVFTADIRVYIYEVMEGAPYSSIGNAMNASWAKKDDSSLLEIETNIVKLLPKNFNQFEGELSDKEKEALTEDGRCNDPAIQTMRPMNMKDYKKDQFRIQRSATALTPIPDPDNNMLYLEAKGAKIKFQPINTEFFPFQVRLLMFRVLGYATMCCHMHCLIVTYRYLCLQCHVKSQRNVTTFHVQYIR
jgi:hypothetical protein